MENILLQAREGRYLTDFEIISNNRRNTRTSFPVHKLLLKLQSAFFFTYFTTPLTENSTCMEIKDGSPHSVDIFLKFFYTATWDLSTHRPSLETIKEVITIAHLYLTHTLLDQICHYLSTRTLTTDAIEIYEFLDIYKNEEYNMINLQKTLIQKLLSDETILQTEDFLDAKESTIVTLFGDENCTFGEIKIWGAVVEWAKRQCRLENVAETPAYIRHRLEGGGVFGLIHFGSFSKKEFLEGPARSKILTGEEIDHVRRPLDGGLIDESSPVKHIQARQAVWVHLWRMHPRRVA